jgi:hypothetical protein
LHLLLTMRVSELDSPLIEIDLCMILLQEYLAPHPLIVFLIKIDIVEGVFAVILSCDPRKVRHSVQCAKPWQVQAAWKLLSSIRITSHSGRPSCTTEHPGIASLDWRYEKRCENNAFSQHRYQTTTMLSPNREGFWDDSLRRHL